MPRTNLSKSKYPPINWLKAAILERKDVLNLTWEDIAKGAKIPVHSMRRYATQVQPQEWPEDIRRNVLRMLGIQARLVIEEDEHAIDL